MARTWLISDTHFAHKNIYTFTKQDGITRVRPEFHSAKEADEFMISEWNRLVSPEDKVYHLGDVVFGGIENIKILRQLHGKKRLILGNHDNSNMKLYLEAGVQKIFGMRQMHGVWLTHAPLHWGEDHSSERVGKFIGNAHGHIHDRKSPTPNHFNVCVEWTGYKPIEFDYVRSVFEKRITEGKAHRV